MSNTDFASAPKPKIPRLFQALAYADPTIADLQRVSKRDVVIIIDKSRSMSEEDCPENGPIFGSSRKMEAVTRWEWCRRQTMHVASQMARVSANSIKLVLFDDRTTEFDNVSVSAISDIFNRYRPSGGTNATRALKESINEYFQRRAGGGSARPLSIICITDGAPSSTRSVKDLIISTSLKLQSPKELVISFLQIGFDDQGSSFLPELDSDLVNDGAKFDIVRSRNFREVTRTGLIQAVLDTAR